MYKWFLLCLSLFVVPSAFAVWEYDTGYFTSGTGGSFGYEGGQWYNGLGGSLSQQDIDDAFAADSSALPSVPDLPNGGYTWPESWGDSLFGPGGCTGCSSPGGGGSGSSLSTNNFSTAFSATDAIAGTVKNIFFVIVPIALVIGLALFGYRLARKTAAT